MTPKNPNSATKTTGTQFIARWPKLIEGMQASPQEMYAQLELSLLFRDIPDLKMSRVDWREGGLFSAQREYLRIEWKRYICDYCAAPFGSGFFFSYWLVLIPFAFTAIHFLGMVVSMMVLPSVLGYMLTASLGIKAGLLSLFFLYFCGIPALWYWLKDGTIKAEGELQQFLLGLTIFGPILELFGRTLTYYEHDNISMFLAASHQALVDVVDEAVKGKGLTPLTEADKKPIMQEFFLRKK